MVKKSFASKFITVATVFAPLLAGLVAIYLLWNKQVFLADMVVLFVMYIITVSGVTLGFHRLFTHKSFKTKTWFRFCLGAAGTMSSQGPIMYWVADHRFHHTHSDTPEDLHSPHKYGSGFTNLFKGYLHSHMGWMLKDEHVNPLRHAIDLARDPVTIHLTKYYFRYIALGILLPGIAMLAVEPNWIGFLRGIFWGGILRILVVHHVTWSVNSICHLFGSRDFNTKDESRNNLLFGVIGLGEGWHNNHHAFPTSARHGLLKYQLDISYLFLLMLRKVGIVSDLVLPSKSHLERKKVELKEEELV